MGTRNTPNRKRSDWEDSRNPWQEMKKKAMAFWLAIATQRNSGKMRISSTRSLKRRNRLSRSDRKSNARDTWRSWRKSMPRSSLRESLCSITLRSLCRRRALRCRRRLRRPSAKSNFSNKSNSMNVLSKKRTNTLKNSRKRRHRGRRKLPLKKIKNKDSKSSWWTKISPESKMSSRKSKSSRREKL